MKQWRPVYPKVKQNSTDNKCWRGCGEKGILLHYWWECKLVQPVWKTIWSFLKKKTTRVAIWPSNTIPRYVLSRSVVLDSATPGTAAHQAPLSMGIVQARILEWVAMPSSRGSLQLRVQTQASCIAGEFFTVWDTREAHSWVYIWTKL